MLRVTSTCLKALAALWDICALRLQIAREFCYTVGAVINRGESLVRKTVLNISAFLFAAAILAGAAPAGAQGVPSGACDRTCLNAFVDQYLDALVAHDPSRLAVTKFVKARAHTNSMWTTRKPDKSASRARCRKRATR
jgi:hypothetical protein